MVKLANVLSRLKPANILVIGDMLLDAYTMGKARRISPEAPVAVVNVMHEEYRPGGAGNVILNLLSLGAEVTAVGRVGHDWAGERFNRELQAEGVETKWILPQQSFSTPVKNRIIADNQQIVRVDHEQVTPLSESLEQQLIDNLPEILQDVKIVAISDYGKGFLTEPLLSALITHAQLKGICIITDPKGHDFAKYKGTTIIKPNLGEAYAAASLPRSAPLEKAAQEVLKRSQAKLLMVTRSEEGISLFDDAGGRADYPVHAKEVKDVTGAGDTVLAMLAHALASDLSYGEAAQLCNVAAGIAIEHVGCARVALSDLALRLFEQHKENKVFDQDHLFVLQEVLKQKPYQLLILNQFDRLTQQLYQAVKTVASDDEQLLVYIDEIEPAILSIEMLASLRELDFIVLHLDSLKQLCQSAAPKAAYLYDADQEQLQSIKWSSYCSLSPQTADV
jgi:D-beta-D-heptose 7-phosphate kinase/D-beta-D-heptose 1-phosphate adenosyltransferase